MHWRRVLAGVVCWLASVSPALANALENVRIWPAPDETRVVMDMAAELLIRFLP